MNTLAILFIAAFVLSIITYIKLGDDNKITPFIALAGWGTGLALAISQLA